MEEKRWLSWFQFFFLKSPTGKKHLNYNKIKKTRPKTKRNCQHEQHARRQRTKNKQWWRKKRPSTYTVSSLSDGLLNLLVFGGNGIVGVHIKKLFFLWFEFEEKNGNKLSNCLQKILNVHQFHSQIWLAGNPKKNKSYFLILLVILAYKLLSQTNSLNFPVTQKNKTIMATPETSSKEEDVQGVLTNMLVTHHVGHRRRTCCSRSRMYVGKQSYTS